MKRKFWARRIYVSCYILLGWKALHDKLETANSNPARKGSFDLLGVRLGKRKDSRTFLKGFQTLCNVLLQYSTWGPRYDPWSLYGYRMLSATSHVVYLLLFSWVSTPGVSRKSI